jgi:hypothetical protein
MVKGEVIRLGTDKTTVVEDEETTSLLLYSILQSVVTMNLRSEFDSTWSSIETA